ncbi:MAG: glycosyltransferase family 2 protein [Bacteroidia bacterium]|jgi:glycosyltransferase involved in cell wall biosynthesis
MEQPFFSVIIPAYNRASILPETIESIKTQSFHSWEIIVVDDGSKDNTRAVVESLMQADARIKYIYQNNAERSAARNNGARNAQGRYLFFLDSDDGFEPHHMHEVHALLQKEAFPVGMVFSNVLYLKESGIEKPEIPDMENGRGFDYVLRHPITPSRVCVHRDVFEVFQFDPEIVIVEDQVLWICIATRFPVFHQKGYTVRYRIHDGNSIDLSRDSYRSRYVGLLRLFNHPKYAEVSAQIPTEQKKHMLAECAFNRARHHEFVGQISKMNSMLLLSFKHKMKYRNKERAYLFVSNVPLLGKFIVGRKH